MRTHGLCVSFGDGLPSQRGGPFVWLAARPGSRPAINWRRSNERNKVRAERARQHLELVVIGGGWLASKLASWLGDMQCGPPPPRACSVTAPRRIRLGAPMCQLARRRRANLMNSFQLLGRPILFIKRRGTRWSITRKQTRRDTTTKTAAKTTGADLMQLQRLARPSGQLHAAPGSVSVTRSNDYLLSAWLGQQSAQSLIGARPVKSRVGLWAGCGRRRLSGACKMSGGGGWGATCMSCVL